MGFEKAGTFKLSKSGKSLTVEYTDPYSLFIRKLYLNLEDVKRVLGDTNKEGPVFILAAEENNKSCESHRS